MDLKQERQLSFVEALKALDYEKQYMQTLKDIAEVMFDMDFSENNEVNVEPNEE